MSDQEPVYGACGVEGCTDCFPLHDADNRPTTVTPGGTQ